MRVLLAVDGSTASECAAALVANLAWPVSTTIKVLTAFPLADATFRTAMPEDLSQDRGNELEAAAQALVAGTADRLTAPHVTVETKIVREGAAEAILDESEQFGADLIVVGNRGHGAFASAVLGSVCSEVVDRSHRPVLVTRRDHIDRILFGEDGSECAAAAVELIHRWSVFHRGSVRVLSVGEADDASAANASEQLRALTEATASVLRTAGLSAEAEVRGGSPAHQLVEAAAGWDADLIVVGSRGHGDQGGHEEHLVGSVARSVLYHARCSVLIVPEPVKPAAEAVGVADGKEETISVGDGETIAAGAGVA